MPYYLHRASVTEAELQAAIDTLLSSPFSSEYSGCGCPDCRIAKRRELEAYEALVAATASVLLGTFAEPGEAHKAKGVTVSPEPLSVTFLATASERSSWRRRERTKGGTDPLPWAHESWQVELNVLHHAYVSILKPGLIAYTPSEEWGVADRQQAVRPGRYLEQFRPELTQRERDLYCAQVKTLDDRNVVKFAKSAEEIEQVYRRGPESCMSHPVDSYVTDVHPVTVYGDSDLQLAYLGDLDGKVRARCMVYPEKKILSRLYGDDTLEILLRKMGYSKGDEVSVYGDLSGARIHAVNHYADYWVMPYIDATACVRLSADRKWFELQGPNVSRSEVRQSYSCRQTNGATSDSANRSEDDEESFSCAHCGDDMNSDDHPYCSSCEDDRRECCCCGHEFFTDRPDRVASADDEPVCARCIRNGRVRQCVGCGDLFREDDIDSRYDRLDFGVMDRCESCGDEAREAEAVDLEARINAATDGGSL